MKKNTINSIVEDLFYVSPIIHKKLLKMEPEDAIPGIPLSRIHISLLLIINDEKELSISDIAKRLLIPKPQMTHLISHLVEQGLIERLPNTRDRRVINVSLTPAGQDALKKAGKVLKKHVQRNLSYLTDEELEDLSRSLSKLREIGSKLW